jgi:hypothetical protein
MFLYFGYKALCPNHHFLNDSINSLPGLEKIALKNFIYEAVKNFAV